MRLVIDGRRLGPGRTGVGRYLEGLLAEWTEIGPPMDDTTVVLHDPAGRGLVAETSKIRAVVAGAGWPGLVWERWGLGRILRGGDLLFAPTNLIPSTWRGPTVLVAFDALPYAIPESFPRAVRWRFGPRYRKAARRADRVIVPSEATARDIKRFYDVDPGRIRVIRPAPGPEFEPIGRGQAKIRAGDAPGYGPYVLFLGKRSRRRNIPAILDGFARFRADHAEFRLVFAGPGRLEEDIGPGLADRGLVDLGHVAEGLLPSLISGATALLYPSNYEGFGLPIVEALACGCPVLTLRNSALTEAGGDAAIYLDSADPGLICDALSRLADDSAYRLDRVALGLAWAGHWTRRQFAEAVKAELIDAARTFSL